MEHRKYYGIEKASEMLARLTDCKPNEGKEPLVTIVVRIVRCEEGASSWAFHDHFNLMFKCQTSYSLTDKVEIWKQRLTGWIMKETASLVYGKKENIRIEISNLEVDFSDKDKSVWIQVTWGLDEGFKGIHVIEKSETDPRTSISLEGIDTNLTYEEIIGFVCATTNHGADEFVKI